MLTLTPLFALAELTVTLGPGEVVAVTCADDRISLSVGQAWALAAALVAAASHIERSTS
ncbi:hypothetical protein [Microbacterium sp. RU33B]|uniref:hypothetical protein n=1 Tax=Microbacterium sp. RU33B TaxID=1907390 RepID=UPI00095AF7ED|nr:hypothetical protein [Microbacterium sp. RU33B]SIT72402.1 hypothetical protein SAMN05880545_1046 [Microbacterium sp. RU33B]